MISGYQGSKAAMNTISKVGFKITYKYIFTAGEQYIYILQISITKIIKTLSDVTNYVYVIGAKNGFAMYLYIHNSCLLRW